MKTISAILAVLALPAVLAGCADAPPGGDARPLAGRDTCGAAGFRHLIGQPVSAVEALQLSVPVRIVPPEGAVTLDYRAERINFVIGPDTGAGRVVKKVTCG